MERRDACVFGVILCACSAPIAGITYACVHFYNLMIRSNHVKDRGSKEDQYEWSFSVFFVLCALSITVYILAWTRFIQLICAGDDSYNIENESGDIVGVRNRRVPYREASTEEEIEL